MNFSNASGSSIQQQLNCSCITSGWSMWSCPIRRSKSSNLSLYIKSTITNHCVCKLKLSYHIKNDNLCLTSGQRDCDDVHSSLFAIVRNLKKCTGYFSHAIFFSPGREYCLHILDGKCQTGKWSWSWKFLWGCGEQVKIGYESSMVITESWHNTLKWGCLRVALSSISLPNTRLQHVLLPTIT